MNKGFDIEQYVRNKVTPDRVSLLTKEEKTQWIKNRFGLSHGGSNKNKKKKARKK